MENGPEIFLELYFGWTLGAIFILSFITFFIYLKVRESSFLYYSIYTLFLNLYIGLKAFMHYNIDDADFHNSSILVAVNWSLQFIYYLFYVQFIRAFFNFKINAPKFDVFIKYFMWAMATACTVFVFIIHFIVSKNVADTYQIYLQFIVYFYIPLFVIFGVYGLYKASKLNILGKNYIIVGSTIYVSSAIISTYFSVTEELYAPLRIFMIGVVIEFVFFAIALGMKVYQVFIQKNEYHQKLIVQLEENKRLIEYNNEILTNKIELYTKKEIELEFKNKINKLKSKVFRSQVNSHFIFNILNSIKGSIVNNNKENAIDYLNKFSKLIRNILNHSLEESVTLEKEIEITKLYVLLENLRFENQIDFNLKVDKNILSTNSIKIPPFVIQPFVENAIWHGLANKMGKKTLKITINKLQDELEIIIKDNGIGLLKSMEIQKNKIIKHKSIGIDITKERLNIFAQSSTKGYSLIFENIGPKNNSKGTKVIINLPLKTIES